jgi:hypothetical protein
MSLRTIVATSQATKRSIPTLSIRGANANTRLRRRSWTSIKSQASSREAKAGRGLNKGRVAKSRGTGTATRRR